MLPVITHPHANADIAELYPKDPKNMAYVLATLQEMEQSEDMQDTMFLHDRDFEDVNCKEVTWHQRRGRNVWRLRRHDRCKKYRIIYAFQEARQGQKPKFIVLAVAHKDNYDYEPEHPLTQRIIDDYEDSIF